MKRNAEGAEDGEEDAERLDGEEGFEAVEDSVEGDGLGEFEVLTVVDLIRLDLGDDLAEGEDGDEVGLAGGDLCGAGDGVGVGLLELAAIDAEAGGAGGIGGGGGADLEVGHGSGNVER